MIVNDLLADLQLNQVVLLSSHFDVSESAPRGDAEMALTVDTTDTTYELKEHTLIGVTRVTVIMKLFEKGSPDVPNAELNVGVIAVASAPDEGENTSEDVRRRLRWRGIEDGYSYIKTHVAQLAGVSPMLRLTLPTINVSALMD